MRYWGCPVTAHTGHDNRRPSPKSRLITVFTTTFRWILSWKYINQLAQSHCMSVRLYRAQLLLYLPVALTFRNPAFFAILHGLRVSPKKKKRVRIISLNSINQPLLHWRHVVLCVVGNKFLNTSTYINFRLQRFKIRVAQIFRKTRSHFRILGARRLTWKTFHIGGGGLQLLSTTSRSRFIQRWSGLTINNNFRFEPKFPMRSHPLRSSDECMNFTLLHYILHVLPTSYSKT